ncbi:hypothetical protein [Streptomyces sp. NPDC003090]|uniref:hypothetical protein n=1 Tax=Streptomyces sp. NPDC003090 TaxID=3154274 RepID=UPI00382A75CD
MTIKSSVYALLVSVALITTTGCGMNDSSDEVPFAGASTSRDAADRAEKVSSEIYDLIGLRGRASETRPGVMGCSEKDRAKYFRVFHPWTFTPAAGGDLRGVMERLKGDLTRHGWTVVRYGPDSSRDRNLTLTADHDEKKVSVEITYNAKEDPADLSIFLVSGCYQTPDGEEVQRF